MKKYGLALLFALLATSIQAKDDVYIGLEFGASRFNAETTASSNPADVGEHHDGYSTYQVLRLGKYFDAHRVSFAFDAGREIGFDYDYFFDPLSFAQSLSPYIGTGVHYNTVQYIDNVSAKGLRIPLSVGLEYVLDDKFSLNTGLRLDFSSYETSGASYDYKSSGSSSLFVAILYKL